MAELTGQQKEDVLGTYLFFRRLADTIRITGQKLEPALKAELSLTHREALLALQAGLPEYLRMVEAELDHRQEDHSDF